MIATIDTANARIPKIMTLWPEPSFFIAVPDKSLVSMASGELISCGLFICEVADGWWLLRRYEAGQPNGLFETSPIDEKYGTP